MDKGRWLIVLAGILLISWGCQSSHPYSRVQGDFGLQSGMKIHVKDVSNDTKEVLDVDVIGLFWDALQVSLKKKDLLWSRHEGIAPVEMEAHVLKYKKGSAVQRWVMPGFGSTVLEARIDLKQGDRLLGSIEVRRTVATGDGLTRGGWKKVFNHAAEDAVNALVGDQPT